MNHMAANNPAGEALAAQAALPDTRGLILYRADTSLRALLPPMRRRMHPASATHAWPPARCIMRRARR